MNKPRSNWWGYVKSMIRRYPALCRQRSALQEIHYGGWLSGLPAAKSRPGDPVANAALRALPALAQRELAAVEAACAATAALPDGQERLRLIRLVYWQGTHTLEGAALQLHRCPRTILQWHGEFIRAVARAFGLG
ncbi:MAG: hypothetical protein PHO10_12155 [Gemmiger sp.]|nr:hypothetical protein [Gemmiger sp.]